MPHLLPLHCSCKERFYKKIVICKGVSFHRTNYLQLCDLALEQKFSEIHPVVIVFAHFFFLQPIQVIHGIHTRNESVRSHPTLTCSVPQLYCTPSPHYTVMAFSHFFAKMGPEYRLTCHGAVNIQSKCATTIRELLVFKLCIAQIMAKLQSDFTTHLAVSMLLINILPRLLKYRTRL